MGVPHLARAVAACLVPHQCQTSTSTQARQTDGTTRTGTSVGPVSIIDYLMYVVRIGRRTPADVVRVLVEQTIRYSIHQQKGR